MVPLHTYLTMRLMLTAEAKVASKVKRKWQLSPPNPPRLNFWDMRKLLMDIGVGWLGLEQQKLLFRSLDADKSGYIEQAELLHFAERRGDLETRREEANDLEKHKEREESDEREAAAAASASPLSEGIGDPATGTLPGNVPRENAELAGASNASGQAVSEANLSPVKADSSLTLAELPGAQEGTRAEGESQLPEEAAEAQQQQQQKAPCVTHSSGQEDPGSVLRSAQDPGSVTQEQEQQQQQQQSQEESSDPPGQRVEEEDKSTQQPALSQGRTASHGSSGSSAKSAPAPPQPPQPPRPCTPTPSHSSPRSPGSEADPPQQQQQQQSLPPPHTPSQGSEGSDADKAAGSSPRSAGSNASDT
ncbi:unnamed protein product [Polarella glacialis]|uniref:EF-hand domain-containing protein n=1 Tax=Polarella glacialis TaxID=89957 RepID=A0A813IBD3_POLGL|nr:unnamed protein product [Polarella glacialis]